MKITFVSTSLEQYVGGEKVIATYANALADRDHKVNVVVSRGRCEYKMSAGIIEVEPLSILHLPKEFHKKARGPQSERRELSRSSKMNVSKSIGRDLLTLIGDTVKFAAKIPQSDVIVATWIHTSLAVLYASKIKKKGKAYLLCQDAEEMLERAIVSRWLLRIVPKFFDRIITISKSMADEISRNTRKKAIIIRDGIDEVFHPRSIEKKGGDTRMVFYVGPIICRKGIFDLFEAMTAVTNRVPNATLVIASRDDIPNDLPPYPIKYIKAPSDTHLAELYSACDVFVYPSWIEGFGLPPLEAMNCGAPVVLTDSGGIREFAVNERNCLIVPIKRPDLLADAIIRILSDSKLAERLRKNGFETAEKFRWNVSIEEFENSLFYQD